MTTSTAPDPSSRKGHPPEADEALGVLVDRLFDVATGDLAAYRDHARGEHGELVGPLLVDAAGIEAVVEQTSVTDLALPLLLSGQRQQVRAARDLLADDDRLEVRGVRLAALPAQGSVEGATAASAVQRLLESLDFTVPAWLVLHPGPGAAAAMDVVASDGAEHLTLVLGADPDDAAGLLHDAVVRGLPFRLGACGPSTVTTTRRPEGSVGSDGSRGSVPARVIGWLNVLCAVHHALAGAPPAVLADVLARDEIAGLVATVLGMSPADAAALRRMVAGVEVEAVDLSAHLERLRDLDVAADSWAASEH